MEATKLKCIGIDEKSGMVILETPKGEKIYSSTWEHILSEPLKGSNEDWEERDVIGKTVTFDVI